MNDLKKQNLFFAFLKNIRQQTRLCVKSFLVAAFILALLAMIYYVALYLYISSGGLGFVVGGLIGIWLYSGLGIVGLSLCLYSWALICLIVSVINIKKPTNIVFTILGTILVFTIHYLCTMPTVSRIFGQPDKDIMRYYARSMNAIEKLNEFSQEIQSLSTDEKYTFTEQSINELSEKLFPYGKRDYINYIFYSPCFDFNKNLLGLKPSEIHTEVVMLFESENNESSFSDSNNISANWHLDRGSLIIFSDGQLEFIKKENFKNLHWKP